MRIFSSTQWARYQPYFAVKYLQRVINQTGLWGAQRAITEGLGEIASVYSVNLIMEILRKEQNSPFFIIDQLRTYGDHNIRDFFKKLRKDGFKFPREGYSLQTLNKILTNNEFGQRLLYRASKGRLTPEAITFISKRPSPGLSLDPGEIRNVLELNYPQYLGGSRDTVSIIEKACLEALRKLYGGYYKMKPGYRMVSPYILEFLNRPDLPDLKNPVALLVAVATDQQLYELNMSLTRWRGDLDKLNYLLESIPKLEKLGLSYKSAVSLVLQIISKGHRSDTVAVSDLISRNMQLEQADCLLFLESLIKADIYFRWKIKILRYVSEIVTVRSLATAKKSIQADQLTDVINKAWPQLSSIIQAASSGEISSSQSRRLLEGSRKVMSGVRLAMIKFIIRRETSAKEEALIENETFRQKIMLIVSETNSLAKLEDEWPLMREMTRKSLEVLFKTGSRQAVTDFLMNFSQTNLRKIKGAAALPKSNKEIRAQLIRAGYSGRLWTQGLDFEMSTTQGTTLEDKIKSIRQDSFEMIEIAVSLGIKNLEGKSLSLKEISFIETLDQARNFMAAMEKTGVKIPFDKEERLRNIIGKIERVASIPITLNPPKKTFRVTVKKDFLNEATAGLGVPGCFAPMGQASEMPLIHAMEANSGFIQIFDETGKQVANAVVIYTTNGAYVFPPYSYSGSTYRPMFYEAILRLTELVPRVVIPNDTQTGEDLIFYGFRPGKTLKLVKPPTLFTEQYFDGEGENRNGNLTLTFYNPLVLTSASVKRRLKKLPPKDSAMITPGGIDLTASKKSLNIQNDNGEIKFHIDPAMLEELQNAPGFVPVIINIQPLESLSKFLGIAS